MKWLIVLFRLFSFRFSFKALTDMHISSFLHIYPHNSPVREVRLRNLFILNIAELTFQPFKMIYNDNQKMVT